MIPFYPRQYVSLRQWIDDYDAGSLVPCGDFDQDVVTDVARLIAKNPVDWETESMSEVEEWIDEMVDFKDLTRDKAADIVEFVRSMAVHGPCNVMPYASHFIQKRC